MFYTAVRNHSSRVHRPASRPVPAPKALRLAGHDEIARLAYSYWEAGGRRGDTALADWLRAERVLNGDSFLR